MTSIAIADNQTISVATGGRDLGPDGPLILLVHGAGMDRTVWALQTRWLAHHACDALAIDLPGHGASPEPELADVDAYADWVATVVGRLARPVHLVGHSMGSFIAIEAAIRTELASVTLIGTASAMPVHPALLEAAEANDPLAAALMSGWAFAPRTRTGAHPAPGSSMVGGARALIEQSAPGVLHHDLVMCAAYDSAVQSASRIDAPTTLLLGELDRMTPPSKAQPLIDAIPDSRVTVADGVGHMIQIEAPELTRTLIAQTVMAAASV